MRILIANVLYTATDETYYVLNSPYEKADSYQADTLDAAIRMLEQDGWTRCGKVQRSDYVNVDAMTNSKNEMIAIWQE